jgi:ubiquinone/menaquinone biosynthesis C-methylase UbiE
VSANHKAKDMGMSSNEISTQEWYDFISSAASLAPSIHVGDQKATWQLIELLSIGPGDHVLDIGSGAALLFHLGLPKIGLEADQGQPLPGGKPDR